MKLLSGLSLCVSLLLVGMWALAADKTPPATLVFESKLGNVTFTHAKHIERAENKCETCHDSLFPQSREPINYAKGMHKPAETAKTACAACHHEGGKAFASKGQCKNCHVK
jgi:c(7)-type cytochrome triheme protein